MYSSFWAILVATQEVQDTVKKNRAVAKKKTFIFEG